MLGGVPFGPYQAEDHVRFLGGAGPDLLAVDDEFVAFDPGAGLETGEVRSRSGFGIALAPHHIARERRFDPRSEEHTSELQSLMRISYAVFCLKNNNKQHT